MFLSPDRFPHNSPFLPEAKRQVAERCSLACKGASLAALSALARVLLAGPGPSRRTGWVLMQPTVQSALLLLRSAHSAPLEVSAAFHHALYILP